MDRKQREDAINEVSLLEPLFSKSEQNVIQWMPPIPSTKYKIWRLQKSHYAYGRKFFKDYVFYLEWNKVLWKFDYDLWIHDISSR